ncbi:MAG: hypothetical protein ACOWWM_01485 [Desulfobacterales bacterium]
MKPTGLSRKNRLPRIAAGSLLLLLILSPAAFSDPCDRSLSPFPGSGLGYGPIGNRCEGFYVSDISAGSLEVVSLVRGRLRFDWNPETVLEVSVSPEIREVVHVRAVAIPLRTYYRMDGDIRVGGKLVWPVKDILFPANLTPERIGIFGWTGAGADRVFVPLEVRQIDPPPPGRPPTAGTHLVIRATVDVDSYLWRTAPASGGHCRAFGKWLPVENAPIHAGAPVSIRIQEDSGRAARICLEVAAKSRRDAEWLKLSMHLEAMAAP